MSSYVRYCMQSKTVVDLVVVIEVLSDGVNDQTEEIRVLMHEQGDREVALVRISVWTASNIGPGWAHNLFLAIL